jgi:AmmeMemoRadiSam system protein B/AmmeMemoRadiSam system protein A
MKKIILIGFIGILALAGSGRAQGLRKAVWAGQFYDADPAQLGRGIDGYLAAAKPVLKSGGRPVAIIVPHAGYVYSGKTAAEAYKLLQGADIQVAVILGPSHQFGFRGCSIYTGGGFETPLGIAEVDREAAQALSRASGFGFIPEAHKEEHSIEVQVPFLQRVLPKARIVPVVMGIPAENTIRTLAAALTKALKGRKAIVIASTDMSHFLSKGEANALDRSTIDLVRSQKMNDLLARVERGENIMCGGEAVAAALLYAQAAGDASVEILKYDDSTSGGGPADRVVGYFSAAITVAAPFNLSADEKKELLRLARQSVELFVREGKTLSYETSDPNFTTPRGAFVTLTKKRELRGCIGFIEPVAPLAQAVIRCAIYAASEDPRFGPVAPAELGDLDYEISVLTPLRKIMDPSAVQVGRHGLVIAQGGRRGLLLPQVATENGWDREEFLRQTCLKAGLVPDAWKRGAEISTFEALVFH